MVIPRRSGYCTALFENGYLPNVCGASCDLKNGFTGVGEVKGSSFGGQACGYPGFACFKFDGHVPVPGEALYL